jgi:hypothetical protein
LKDLTKGGTRSPSASSASSARQGRSAVVSCVWSAALLSAALLFAGCGSSVTEFEQQLSPARETFGTCAVCHSGLANRMLDTGGHASLRIKCERCHDQLLEVDAGPGHRSVPACAECHRSEETHQDPEAGTEGQCLVCHTPHGSPNLFLVRERIVTPEDIERPIVLNNLEGLADGSFASISDPGSGVCEVCHTTTLYYRNDGTGEDHFPFTCFTCHSHGDGFIAR